MNQYFSNKFYDDGRFKYYRGTTIISKIVPATPENNMLVDIQNQFKLLPFADKFAFLPAESFHMTVMELVNDKARDLKLWSKNLPIDIPFDQVEIYFIQNWKKIEQLDFIPISITEVRNNRVLMLSTTPADKITKKCLTDFRNSIADIFGVKKPDHENYEYHITLAYRLFDLSDKEQQIIDQLTDKINKTRNIKGMKIQLPAPELCFYEDMSQFNNAVLE